MKRRTMFGLMAAGALGLAAAGGAAAYGAPGVGRHSIMKRMVAAPPITLAATGDGHDVRLSVTDQGEGIAPAERERVLAPFYRLDRARTPHAGGEPPHGFGLGLTLARRIAEVHGGRIAVEPATVEHGREQGCRVVLILPGQPSDGTPVTSEE